MKNEQQSAEHEDLPQKTKEDIQNLLDEAAVKKQWLKEMENNHALQQYFARFTPESVKDFINHLHTYKMMWLKYGPSYNEKMETDGIEWIDRAYAHLEYLQQKKLFDVQCLWRADKLQLENIQVCFDFQIWEKNIFNCPLIEPIQKDELDLYIKYLLESAEFSPLMYGGSWQDYEEVKSAYNEDTDDFDWYDFYNLHKGTGIYMVLPNIKGEKENFYRDLYFEAHKKEREERQAEFDKTRDKRETLYRDTDQMKWYVETFENKEVQKMYHAYEWQTGKWEIHEMLEDELRFLQDADEYVPIEAHHDWKEAVQKAASKYRAKKIADAMPQAWERYNMNIEMGIAFPSEEDKFYQEIRAIIVGQIIEGRILNGEPGDLNFNQ